MPSLAQGYGRGLMLGLQLQDVERQRKREELSDEFLRERLEDMRWGREKEKKSLLATIKQWKEEEEQGQIGAGLTHLGMQEGGEHTLGGLATDPFVSPEVRTKVHGAMSLIPGLDWGEQREALRVRERVEGAPGAVPWGVSEIDESKIPQAAEIALGLMPKARTEGKATLGERGVYWLGQPHSKTPPGMRNYLTNKGYEQEPGTDKWKSTPKGTDVPNELVSAKFILKEANKKDMLGRKIYTRPAQVDEMVGIWAKHNKNYGGGSLSSDNAYVALGLPTPEDRPNLKKELERLPADEQREQLLNEIGYKANIVEWILETYSTW